MAKKKKSIFVTYSEKKGGAHYDFVYETLHYDENTNLFVHITDDAVFFKEYLKYLNPTKTPNGGTQFDWCGINSYTKEQTRIMYERILNDKPLDCEILLAWLEKAVNDPKINGFYIHGI